MDVRWQQLDSAGRRTIVFTLILVLWSCGAAAMSEEEVKPHRSGALPVLVFQTDGKAVQDRTRVQTKFTLLKPGKDTISFAVDDSASGWAELSVRGNSSFFYSKKSYRLELQDNNRKDRKASLLEMPADSDWVLYASVTDTTFVRNSLGHEIWRSTGRYAVRWQFVEVFVLTNTIADAPLPPQKLESGVTTALLALSKTNGQPINVASSNIDPAVSGLTTGYMGLYVLMEKIKRGKERVNIIRLRPEHVAEPEISGGYIIKKDDYATNERGLLTGQEFRLRYQDPKESEVTDKQRQWIRMHLDSLERALFGVEFRNPDYGYQKFLDVESFIDFHWLVELARNADGYHVSQYMHKDRGGKLTMGPVWDWDNAFGNPFFRSDLKSTGWRFDTAVDPDYSWYRRLFEDPDFLQRYIDRWSELRAGSFSESKLLKTIDDISGKVRGAFSRNASRWPVFETSGIATDPKLDLLQLEVNWLKKWISDRITWIDNQEYPKPILQAVSDTNGMAVAMAFLDGRLFFTTNGVDPRTPGGGVAPIALEYSKPVEVKAPVKIKARTRSKFGLWSAPVVLNVAPSGTNAVVDRQEGR